MTLLPRTLLWRSVLLIALVLAVAHLAWLQIFRVSQREPTAQRIAQQIVSVVNLTRAALVSAQPDRRIELLRDLSASEGIRVFVARSADELQLPPDRPVLRSAMAEVRRELGPDTRFAIMRNGEPGFWVSFRIDDDDEYWVVMPRARIDRVEPLHWVYLGGLVLLLSLGGAFLIVWRVVQPLRALTRAAAEIGAGRTAEPVPESGPREIRTLAHGFNQMAADLQHADAERAVMLAGVSHDLRTPLSRIRLGVEMLDTHIEPQLREGMVQDIEEIDAVVNQFLDFARGSAGDNVAPAADLNALVARVCERYQRQGRPVTLRAGLVPPLPLRELAVERCISNLVNNALRHAKTPVEVETGVDAAHAVISVLDRGPGIPATDIERMLRPFTRLDAARSQSGSGLGLAIVDRIARMHGGRAELGARPGGGLAARVRLPLRVLHG
jgi:two-component system osmolarity sensor histidine kinase EnvZ